MKTNFAKRVLVIHAHPDDTEAFSGGLLVLMQQAGFEINIATTTAGGMGGILSTEKDTISKRLKEAALAAQSVGATYHCLGGRDGFLFDSDEIRLKTLSLIRSIRPGVILTHLPGDYHADHRATAQIVEMSAMLSTLPNAPVPEEPLDVTPLLYHTAPLGLTDPLGGHPPKPHFYVNIGGVMEQKMAMLAHHRTQIELMRLMHKMDDFFGEMKVQSRELGRRVGVDYAECFWQHLGGGFQKTPFLQNNLQPYLINHSMDNVS
ncbi:MAG: PIG-L family deacetylase [Planctomycetes bacterium]|nr:PIG-L family deacetylase [Planctomycetota bacterium]